MYRYIHIILVWISNNCVWHMYERFKCIEELDHAFNHALPWFIFSFHCRYFQQILLEVINYRLLTLSWLQCLQSITPTALHKELFLKPLQSTFCCMCMQICRNLSVGAFTSFRHTSLQHTFDHADSGYIQFGICCAAWLKDTVYCLLLSILYTWLFSCETTSIAWYGLQ